MRRFNHAFDIGFEVISETEDGADVTPEMIEEALLDRIAQLKDEARQGLGGLMEAVGAPFDTYEIEEDR